jgi:hypothetical protein
MSRRVTSIHRSIEGLWRRLEPPSEANRWERPLFTVEPPGERAHDETTAPESHPAPPVRSSFKPAVAGSSFRPAASTSSFRRAAPTRVLVAEPAQPEDDEDERLTPPENLPSPEPVADEESDLSPPPSPPPTQLPLTESSAASLTAAIATRGCIDNLAEMKALCRGIRLAISEDTAKSMADTGGVEVGDPDDLLAAAEAPAETNVDSVLEVVLAALPRAAPGERVAVPGSEVPVVLGRVPTHGELNALRRRFRESDAGKQTEGSGNDLLACVAFAQFLTLALQ